MKTTTRLLLFTGLIIPTIFWVSTIIAANLQDNYDHVQHTISQLGATGTPSESFMNGITWLCVILSVSFLIGLWRICSQLHLYKTPLLGVLGFTIMFGWAAIFHAGHALHAKSGPVVLVLTTGPLLSSIVWKRSELKTLRIWSWISFCSMLFILCKIMLPEKIVHNYTGLIQRVVHVGWSIWFISMAVTFRKLGNKKTNNSLS